MKIKKEIIRYSVIFLAMIGLSIVNTFSYNICIDPGHGWNTTGMNGWDNCGPVFNVNGVQYQTLKFPKDYISNPIALSNTLKVPQAEWINWLKLEKRGASGKMEPVGLLEYQNTWKIAGYLKSILENRRHTVHLTKTEHENPKFVERAAVAFDNSCDFMISIHTNAPGNGTTALGIVYAKSEFRVDYYRGTPPPTPIPSPPDTNPAQWLDENIVCKQNMITPTPGSIPYIVGNNTSEQSVWLRIEAVALDGTPRPVPFDPVMVRYKIDHQGSSNDENIWMPAGDNTDDFIITHRQNGCNTWAVAARYIVHDESTPIPVLVNINEDGNRGLDWQRLAPRTMGLLHSIPNDGSTTTMMTTLTILKPKTNPRPGGHGHSNFRE